MLQDGWPPEIDILEIPKERTIHHYYMHYTNPDWYADHGAAWDHEASFGGTHTGADKSVSFHNYGVAFDCVPVVNGKAMWSDDNAYAKLGRIGEGLGLEWAGRWTGKLKEKAHFQFTGGKSLAALQREAVGVA